MIKNIARFFVVFLVVIGMIILSGLYNHFTSAHEQKCLAKFKTIEYEIVSDVLYCKTNDGLIKFN